MIICQKLASFDLRTALTTTVQNSEFTFCCMCIVTPSAACQVMPALAPKAGNRSCLNKINTSLYLLDLRRRNLQRYVSGFCGRKGVENPKRIDFWLLNPQQIWIPRVLFSPFWGFILVFVRHCLMLPDGRPLSVGVIMVCGE